MKGDGFQLRNQRHRNYIYAGVHVIAWFLMLYLPLLGDSDQPKDLRDFGMRSIPMLMAVSVFYINYFILIPRFFFTRRNTLFAGANLVLWILVMVFLEWSRMRFGPPEHANNPVSMEFLVRALISQLSITAVAVAIRITGQWLRSESLRKDLEQEHLKSELVNLKNQLNPHFFFNTLNTIYGLIIQDQDRAQDAVHQLSKLMRYLLYDSNEKLVSLNKEIQFMHHYIDLMRLRSSRQLKVTCELPAGGADVQIAPLLFISLIENAFKHGASGDEEAEIRIHMELLEHRVVFEIGNTNNAKDESDRSGSGIGMENLRRRLGLLYPGHYELDTEVTPEWFQCTLVVRL